MKTIKVVAAIICDNMKEKNKIFATARGYGEFKGGWEFPGGKVEAGETPQQALAREIMEELDTEIKIGEWVDTIEYDYPSFHLSMDCFWAEVTKGHLERCLAAGRYLFDQYDWEVYEIIELVEQNITSSLTIEKLMILETDLVALLQRK